jgi:nucleotide-binding universal stress UspA family protein
MSGGSVMPSVALAEKFRAHLLALSVVPPIVVIAEPNAYPIVIDEHCKAYRERNPTMRAAFEATVANRGLTWEWRDDDAGAYTVLDRVLPCARVADLIVASQTDFSCEAAASGSLDIADGLARHGVKCEATERLRPRVNVGETLLACAEESGAELLVMGCYGHTRLREFVFGGASRHVLGKMNIPVLVSH